MAEVLLFHHVLGVTEGLQEFADALRAGGHTVHVPDLFGGRTFTTIEDGVAHAQSLGDATDTQADEVAAGLPEGLVYAGFSMGGAKAQRLAQTRAGARGALLYESFVDLRAEWAFGPWPDGLGAQVHGMDHDPFFAEEGDLAGAQALAAQVGADQVEVFTYPGDGHLFVDRSSPAYDADAAALVIRRSLEFLDRV